jgi:hypothetical protein
MHLVNAQRTSSSAPVRSILILFVLLCGLLLPRTSSASPEDWLATFESTYESGDAAAYAALLGEDFRFVFGDAENRERFPDGFTRAEELSSYTRLFSGAVTAAGRVLPRAESIDVTWEGVRVMADPEHADDARYAVVLVRSARLAIRFADGTEAHDAAPHAFWLVLVAGDGGGGSGWICRRWVERPVDSKPAIPLAASDPAGGILPAEDGALAAAPLWTAWPNPLRAGQSLSFVYEVAVDGAEVALELFDVTGRARATFERGRRPGGRHLARWDGRNDGGGRLAAGVYFLRARVGDRIERERVILVR